MQARLRCRALAVHAHAHLTSTTIVLYTHRDKVDILDAFREDAFTRSSVILTKLET